MCYRNLAQGRPFGVIILYFVYHRYDVLAFFIVDVAFNSTFFTKI